MVNLLPPIEFILIIYDVSESTSADALTVARLKLVTHCLKSFGKVSIRTAFLLIRETLLTTNCWSVKNNEAGTNTKRIVILTKNETQNAVFVLRTQVLLSITDLILIFFQINRIKFQVNTK